MCVYFLAVFFPRCDWKSHPGALSLDNKYYEVHKLFGNYLTPWLNNVLAGQDTCSSL
jgi:hypothetical protein